MRPLPINNFYIPEASTKAPLLIKSNSISETMMEPAVAKNVQIRLRQTNLLNDPDNYDYIQQSDQLEPENPNNIPLTPELYEYQPPENNILLDYQPNTEVNNLSEDYWNQVESEDDNDNNNVSDEVREQILDELPNIDQKNVEADELLRIEEDVVVGDDDQSNENNFNENNDNNNNDNSDLTDYQLLQEFQQTFDDNINNNNNNSLNMPKMIIEDDSTIQQLHQQKATNTAGLDGQEITFVLIILLIVFLMIYLVFRHLRNKKISKSYTPGDQNFDGNVESGQIINQRVSEAVGDQSQNDSSLVVKEL